MDKYEYRVDSIQAAITESDINKNVANQKVSAQVEMKLKELMQQGFEFHSQFPVTVKVNPSGCLTLIPGIGKLFAGPVAEVTIIVLVFRRLIQ